MENQFLQLQKQKGIDLLGDYQNELENLKFAQDDGNKNVHTKAFNFVNELDESKKLTKIETVIEHVEDIINRLSKAIETGADISYFNY